MIALWVISIQGFSNYGPRVNFRGLSTKLLESFLSKKYLKELNKLRIEWHDQSCHQKVENPWNKIFCEKRCQLSKGKVPISTLCLAKGKAVTHKLALLWQHENWQPSERGQAAAKIAAFDCSEPSCANWLSLADRWMNQKAVLAFVCFHGNY